MRILYGCLYHDDGICIGRNVV